MAATQFVTSKLLLGLLTDAKTDPLLRDQLIKSPSATLESRGLRATPNLVEFLGGLTAQNFEQEMKSAADAVNHPLALGNVAEANA